MSIVEKAAEKLRARAPEPAVAPPALPAENVPAPVHAAPTVERLQERRQAAEPAAPIESAPLWHVDYPRLKRLGILPDRDDAAVRLANELRRAKRPLLDNANGKRADAPPHADRIGVTSAIPGEGKTFTAMNLAMSLAHEPDFEVLLIDGDIPKSDTTYILGLEDHPGLMDVLANDALHPEAVVVRTDIPNLSVIPVGKPHPLTAELFGSQRMEFVLEQLSGVRQRRLVVFDSSPLLATPEAPILAAHMGQIVMVVAAGRTSRQEVALALSGLGGSQFVGMILNKSHLPPGENLPYTYYSRYHSQSPQGEA
ncbi:MAG TPA: AAA family ATPase [Rhodanobacteraceae bacterium]|nr:AAA family ATPase [Rhodanobacteraceae bacterium]